MRILARRYITERPIDDFTVTMEMELMATDFDLSDTIVTVTVIHYHTMADGTGDTWRNGKLYATRSIVYSNTPQISADAFALPLWSAPYYLWKETIGDVLNGWNTLMEAYRAEVARLQEENDND